MNQNIYECLEQYLSTHKYKVLVLFYLRGILYKSSNMCKGEVMSKNKNVCLRKFKELNTAEILDTPGGIGKDEVRGMDRAVS